MNTNVIETATVQGAGIENHGDTITFRKLNSTDMFLMFKIISKIGVNEIAKSFDGDTIKNMSAMAKGDENATRTVGIAIMMNMANVLMSNLPNCEQEIYTMLANTSNLSVEQVKELDFVTFTEMVVTFIKKEEFKDFIKVVLKSFKVAK